MMTLLLQVEQKHIDAGKPCVANDCPIVHAMRDTGHPLVTVGVATVTIYRDYVDNKRKLIAMLPLSGRNFVADFDRGLPVKPVLLKLDFNEGD